jgi:hypothetical protein
MWRIVAVLYVFYMTCAVRCRARVGTGTNRESRWVITCPRVPEFVFYYGLFLMVLWSRMIGEWSVGNGLCGNYFDDWASSCRTTQFAGAAVACPFAYRLVLLVYSVEHLVYSVEHLKCYNLPHIFLYFYIVLLLFFFLHYCIINLCYICCVKLIENSPSATKWLCSHVVIWKQLFRISFVKVV